jgi:hypothetical protein
MRWNTGIHFAKNAVVESKRGCVRRWYGNDDDGSRNYVNEWESLDRETGVYISRQA